MTSYIKREYLPTADDAVEKMAAAGHNFTRAVIGKRLGGHRAMHIDFFYDLVTAYDLGPQMAYLWLMEAARVRAERLVQKRERPTYSKERCPECNGYSSEDAPKLFRCSCDDD